MTSLPAPIRAVGEWFTHSIGRLSGRFYFEDYVRVYPDGTALNHLGIRHRWTENDRNNFLNHVRFYRFASQFAPGKVVADIGCGTGYGAALLRTEGRASRVFGCDMSRHALRFAEVHFAGEVEFSRQAVTDLSGFDDHSVDVLVSSEVLEHIKEYGHEKTALSEFKRVARLGGLVVLSTPNSELLGEHGFSFDEIHELLEGEFDRYLLFENALVPLDPRAASRWNERARTGRTGIVVSESINLAETVLPRGAIASLKTGIQPTSISLGTYEVQTGLLHNTHSWVVVALNQ